MFPLHHFFLVAALSGAVFPLPVISSELDEYNELKAAMVRSTAKKDHLLPNWIRAREFEARPHHYLDSDRVRSVADTDQDMKEKSAEKSR